MRKKERKRTCASGLSARALSFPRAGRRRPGLWVSEDVEGARGSLENFYCNRRKISLVFTKYLSRDYNNTTFTFMIPDYFKNS